MTYKQPCIQCNALVDRDARFCPACGSNSPFGYLCPNCLRQIKKEDRLCAGCGRSTRTKCPFCDGETFKGEKCEKCNENLMLVCPNARCGVRQFFEIRKCTACGKTIPEPKKKKKK